LTGSKHDRHTGEPSGLSAPHFSQCLVIMVRLIARSGPGIKAKERASLFLRVACSRHRPCRVLALAELAFLAAPACRIKSRIAGDMVKRATSPQPSPPSVAAERETLRQPSATANGIRDHS
jgi:hypothetical protein